MTDPSNATILVDANIYLNLFASGEDGAKVLAAIEEQGKHIFVSNQIVDEVTRRKLGVASSYFSNNLTISTNILSHLLGTDETKDIIGSLRKAKADLGRLVDDTLAKISHSEDRVSLRLKSIFDKEVPPTDEEMARARNRKELGNPPGDPSDPLGDQVTWEQFLTYCRNRNGKIWIITNDPDFYTKHGERLLLNPKLYRELKDAGVSDDIYCFNRVLLGIRDFSRVAGVAATKLPDKEQADEIDEEFAKVKLFMVPHPQAGSAMTIASNTVTLGGGDRIFGTSFNIKLPDN